MSPVPNGRVIRLGDRLTLQINRTFAAPIDDVWAAITEPERLGRWLGTWRGDPAEGRVMFSMTFEEGDSEQEMEIRECRPPHRLAVTSHAGPYTWHLEADLVESDGVTTLSFSQPEVDPDQVPSIGPGWEYYLDRLVAAETGADLATIDFDRDYYPAMADHYRAGVAGGDATA
jgi:uncharacterized protein YndB with AHSA1/START domain